MSYLGSLKGEFQRNHFTHLENSSSGMGKARFSGQVETQWKWEKIKCYSFLGFMTTLGRKIYSTTGALNYSAHTDLHVLPFQHTSCPSKLFLFFLCLHLCPHNWLATVWLYSFELLSAGDWSLQFQFCQHRYHGCPNTKCGEERKSRHWIMFSSYVFQSCNHSILLF